MSDILRRYRAWLIMGFTLILNMIFGIAILLPTFQSYTQTTDQLEAARANISATEALSGDNAVLLQSRINRLNETFDTQINGFVQESQVEEILNSLFDYATQTGVVIENMQLQSGATATTNDTVYTRIFHLQVIGEPSHLMNFVVNFQEASVQGVQVQNPVITRTNDSASLSMNVTLYVSPFADGSALSDIPVLDLPVPVVFPTLPPPTATPFPTLPPEQVAMLTNAAPVPVASETAYVPPATCGDAPSTQFAIGDTVIVDFDTATTLRILAQPRLADEDVTILANVADNAILQIMDGPVCGSWEGRNVWYWQVQSGGVTGWAGEANALHRWMCPINQPECASQ